MLDLNTSTRLNATQALAHEYLKQYADPSDEPVAEKYDQSFEDLELDINQWKELVFNELEKYQHHQLAF
ncbi:mitogen-activated protein kinase [Plakobranchus ocellatus]|uniref:Mitogen-activated protein kinase n=1 Tax=Plakobranchus ocellatus TaxID=259542 RepID=A0AAV4C8X6_9GAST|nr:mitogen-activated protein kinase [Plakobranchus ocellatus]